MADTSHLTLSKLGKNETGECVEITLDGKRVGHLAYATSDGYVELVGAALQAPVLKERAEDPPLIEQQDKYVRVLLGDGAKVAREYDGTVKLTIPIGARKDAEILGADWADAFRAALRETGVFQGALRLLADRLKLPVYALKNRLSTMGQAAVRSIPNAKEDAEAFLVEPAT